MLAPVNSIIQLCAKKSSLQVLSAVFVVLAIRGVIYTWLSRNGYFYGIPWDSFSRTLLAYDWSKLPYFAPSDGYWLPFQFWIVGSAFAILRPWIPTSEIIVPVILNNLFFTGSTAVLFLFTYRITKKYIWALLACIMAACFSGDVFVSYTALSEPILIFTILLASYLFYLLVVEKPRQSMLVLLGASVAVCVAAATHYIGWFLVVFFVIYLAARLVYHLINKKFTMVAAAGLGIVICIGMPFLWLWNNYQIFGDAFHPISVARQAQSAYIGQMPPLERFLVTPKVIIEEFYPISILGIIALNAVFFKQTKTLFFFLPTFLVLSMIWLSTWMGLSAPYQEPRYLVFVCWAIIPTTALAGRIFWENRNFFLRAAIIIALLLSLTLNFSIITRFQNSFGPEVRNTALYSKAWLKSKPPTARVFIYSDSFAERGVIPVISGYPDRFNYLSQDEVPPNQILPADGSKSPSYPVLLITKNKGISRQARKIGLHIDQRGAYFLISNDQ